MRKIFNNGDTDNVFGIIISMYYFDNRKHHFPHIHVKCQDKETVMRIPDGEIIEGDLPAGKNKLVQAGLEIHKDELMADGNWLPMGPMFSKSTL